MHSYLIRSLRERYARLIKMPVTGPMIAYVVRTFKRIFVESTTDLKTAIDQAGAANEALRADLLRAQNRLSQLEDTLEQITANQVSAPEPAKALSHTRPRPVSSPDPHRQRRTP